MVGSGKKCLAVAEVVSGEARVHREAALVVLGAAGGGLDLVVSGVGHPRDFRREGVHQHPVVIPQRLSER